MKTFTTMIGFNVKNGLVVPASSCFGGGGEGVTLSRDIEVREEAVSTLFCNGLNGSLLPFSILLESRPPLFDLFALGAPADGNRAAYVRLERRVLCRHQMHIRILGRKRNAQEAICTESRNKIKGIC